ncbi:MAG: lipopolysaccharide biosynthesis protein [Muribaculaceae bacterium]
MNEQELKSLTAKSIKWNLVDKLATQVLYAVTGIVLACILPHEDFGLVGAILIFQAFAQMFIDSGFSSALIQRKEPTQTDYSTVLWFNLGIATLFYIILWLAAPAIAHLFQDEMRLIPLSRVMFLSFILYASSIVQANRLMKQMNVRPIAITNALGLITGGIVGIWLALKGYGAWAIVWQTIATAGTKSLLLWISTRWLPDIAFSFDALKSFFKVGSGVMVTSFFNTVFQNIYSFFVGNRLGMIQLGYYTQADKWSKMGIMSVSQTLTSAFLPTLSSVQDDPERFTRAVTKMNRFTAYILFPAMLFLSLLAQPIFHALFGTKWDMSIILFQLLLIRGIFTVLSGLYSNYLLSLARAKMIVAMEIVRDVTSLAALFITLPMMSLTTPGDIVYGIKMMIIGQIIASIITWLITLIVAAKASRHHPCQYILHLLPYLIISLTCTAAAYPITQIITNPWQQTALIAISTIALYLIINHIFKSQLQKEILQYIFHLKKNS